MDGLWEKRDIEGERGERGRRVKTTFGNRIRRTVGGGGFPPTLFREGLLREKRVFFLLLLGNEVRQHYSHPFPCRGGWGERVD